MRYCYSAANQNAAHSLCVLCVLVNALLFPSSANRLPGKPNALCQAANSRVPLHSLVPRKQQSALTKNIDRAGTANRHPSIPLRSTLLALALHGTASSSANGRGAIRTGVCGANNCVHRNAERSAGVAAAAAALPSALAPAPPVDMCIAMLRVD